MVHTTSACGSSLAGSARTGPREFGRAYQLGDRDVEGLSQEHQGQDAEVEGCSLNPLDASHVDVGDLRKLLLRQPAVQPQATHVRRDAGEDPRLSLAHPFAGTRPGVA